MRELVRQPIAHDQPDRARASLMPRGSIRASHVQSGLTGGRRSRSSRRMAGTGPSRCCGPRGSRCIWPSRAGRSRCRGVSGSRETSGTRTSWEPAPVGSLPDGSIAPNDRKPAVIVTGDQKPPPRPVPRRRTARTPAVRSVARCTSRERDTGGTITDGTSPKKLATERVRALLTQLGDPGFTNPRLGRDR